MLVLTRKTQQQIQFGSDIVITILQVKGQTVRVGIEAPRGVRVVRGEIASKPPREKTTVATATAETGLVTGAEAIGNVMNEGATSNGAMSERPAAHSKSGAVAISAVEELAETFSSPESRPSRVVGESSGLFPLLRRRASNSHKLDDTARRKEQLAPLALRSLAGSRG
jgi:carbon storage regulator CsrA